MMNDKKDNNTNLNAINQLQAKTSQLVDIAMRGGFYGSVSLELIVTDGIVRTIKTNITQNELIKKR